MHSLTDAETSIAARPREQAARRTLREATRADHEFVDSLPLMRRLLHDRVSRVDYGRALERLMLLHAGLRREIEGSIDGYAHPHLRVADLLSALRSDLADLQREPGEAPISAPPLADGAEALGAWYVLEGAALGGAVIARHLHQTLGPDLPVSHFGGRKNGRWPEFLRHLESRLESAGEIEAAVRGARSAYRFAAETLTDPR